MEFWIRGASKKNHRSGVENVQDKCPSEQLRILCINRTCHDPLGMNAPETRIALSESLCFSASRLSKINKELIKIILNIAYFTGTEYSMSASHVLPLFELNLLISVACIVSFCLFWECLVAYQISPQSPPGGLKNNNEKHFFLDFFIRLYQHNIVKNISDKMCIPNRIEFVIDLRGTN